MKLSVVIVNYNVQYFLEQCLLSVKVAIERLNNYYGGNVAEVFVVDNNSIDASVQMLQEKFPEVHLILNQDNKGFSKANNQAIKQAQGEYILLLNPDTVIEADTLLSTVQFMDKTPDAGGLGVMMLDGKGNFLPESKRGLPTPKVAFYKVFGLSKLFPKSKRFAKYHLSYLDKNEIHQVDVLAGAFMLLRKEALNKVGLLDETFFMYGEDIDLSYRLRQAGYKNYYFPHTRIIHYKGESTKKSSLNYIFVFYKAMSIFAKKHFSHKQAFWLTFFIHLAIFIRASMAIARIFIVKIFLPFIDIAVLFSVLVVVKKILEHYFIYPNGGHYPNTILYINFPVYITIWLLSVFFLGGYDKPVDTRKITKGMLVGTILILLVYALLPEELRYSRTLILAGTLGGIIAMLGLRYFLYFTGIKTFKLKKFNKKNILILGSKEECMRVKDLLSVTNININFLGFIATDVHVQDSFFLGNTQKLPQIIHTYKIDEIIFCSKDLPISSIISHMDTLNIKTLDYKIAPPEAIYIIGSNSINTSGELYVFDLEIINQPNNKRNKRLIDIVFSLLFLLTSPLIVLWVKNPKNFLLNIFRILFGKMTFVGFDEKDAKLKELPKLKQGILFPTDYFKILDTTKHNVAHTINLLYAKNYKPITDINIILKNIKYLGR